MKNILLFLFSIVTVVLYSQNKVKVSSIPNWVSFQTFNSNPNVNEDEIIEGTLTLLADYQTNIVTEESYFRLVTKITNNSGIQIASDINASFDPTYQNLIFHSINVIRDGKKINKLNPNLFQVMRRELNAENYLYNGSLSAVANLSDIRNSDIIDVSYTIKGFNPIKKGKFSDSYYLMDYVPIGKINISLISKEPLHYKMLNTELKPVVEKQGGRIRYYWTVEEPVRFEYEENIPTSRILTPTVIIGNYKSITEVVDWAYELYKVKEELSPEIKSHIKEICSIYHTKGERIKALLDFVQNDIRYLGFENGIGNYLPNPPNKVFEQRFGDCKDKSLLLVHLLKEINVDAFPMLLHTGLKSGVLNLPPSPSIFNHCVVKVTDSDFGDFYYDPTLTDQGGLFTNTHFPNYENGLVIYKGNSSFDTIYSSSENYSVAVEEFDILDTKGRAKLKVTTTYTDVEADNARTYFKNGSKTNILKEFVNYYSTYYPSIKSSKSLEFSDNLSTNEFIVTGYYEMDSIWRPMDYKPGYKSISFNPTHLLEVLHLPNFNNRINDFALPYPTARDHQVKINLPHLWEVEELNKTISNNVFYFDFSVQYHKHINQIQFNSYLKFQKPFISKDEFTEVAKDFKDLESQLSYYVFIPEKQSILEEFNIGSDVERIEFNGKIIVFAFLIVLLIIILIKKKLKNRNDLY